MGKFKNQIAQFFSLPSFLHYKSTKHINVGKFELIFEALRRSWSPLCPFMVAPLNV